MNRPPPRREPGRSPPSRAKYNRKDGLRLIRPTSPHDPHGRPCLPSPAPPTHARTGEYAQHLSDRLSSHIPVHTRPPENRRSALARLPYPWSTTPTGVAPPIKNTAPSPARRLPCNATPTAPATRCRQIIAFTASMPGRTRANLPLSDPQSHLGCR